MNGERLPLLSRVADAVYWMARYIEPFTLLIAQLAYGGKESPALAYRFERFQEEELKD